MNKENCFYLGTILKPHGVFGNMVLKVEIIFFDYLIDELESIFIEIDEQLIPFFITEIDYVNDETAIIGLDEILTETSVKEFMNCKVFLPNEMIPEEVEPETDLQYTIGFSVIDTKFGEIGKITDILQYSYNHIFQVIKDGNEILIPVSEEIIEEINTEKKIVRVTTPDGLIEIYTK